MTTEEWVGLARQRCQSALDDPGIQEVAAVFNRAGVSESARREALQSSATAQSPSSSLLKLRDLVKDSQIAQERFPLERKLLLDQALIALTLLNTIPVDESVRQLICKEIVQIADPTEAALPGFSMNVYVFTAMAKIVLFERFPAGHHQWEVSGFPRSWLPKIPLRLLPLTLRFLMFDSGGFSPWFVSHMRATGPGTPFLIEGEFKKSFFRMALALKKQPHIRAIAAQSWLHSPETHRVSPHLAFLNKIFLEAGGIVTDLGTAGPDDGFAAGNKQRAELYRKGEYKPTVGVAACSRQQAIAWAEQHSEMERLLVVI